MKDDLPREVRALRRTIGLSMLLLFSMALSVVVFLVQSCGEGM